MAEWAAGLLVAYCLEARVTPRAVHADAGRTWAYQQLLREQGVELQWPENLNLDDGDPHAHAR